jgi:hypothetical protein
MQNVLATRTYVTSQLIDKLIQAQVESEANFAYHMYKRNRTSIHALEERVPN